MYKKFLITFVLAMGVFGTVAFAGVLDNSKTINLDSNPYYIQYTSSSGNVWIYTFTTVTENGSIFGDVKSYQKINGEYVFSENHSQGVSFNYVVKDIISNNSFLYNYMYDNDLVNGGIIPPKVAPTVEKAIQGIAPQFLKQLGQLLPIGVIILSLVLGVSLIPRLRYFM